MAKRNVYRGGSSARDYDLFGPNLRYEWISPQLARAKAISDETLREEYSRLRAIANKRIKRMEGRPEAAGTYEQHAGGFPTVRGMSREELVYQLGEVSSFLVARRGSMSGIKEHNKEILEALNKARKDPQTGKELRPAINVSPDQLANFGTFMTKLKKALGIKSGEWDSDRVASYWDSLMENGKISKKKFNDTIEDLIMDLEEHRKAEMTEEREAVKRLVRSTNLSDFFGDINLDPRTRAAEKRRKRGR